MKKLIIVAIMLAAFIAPMVAQAQIVDYQVNNDAKIKGSKILYPEFATVTDGSAPSAATFLSTTKRALRVGDIIKKTSTAEYYVCTSTTGPAWKKILYTGASGASGSCTAGSVTYSFSEAGRSDNGMTLTTGSDNLQMCVAGAAEIAVTSTYTGFGHQLLAPVGAATAGNVSYSFAADVNTGMFSTGADGIGFSTGGTQRLSLSTTLLTSTLPLVLPAGAVGAPAVYFTGSATTGLYQVGADNPGIAIGGALKLDLSATLLNLAVDVKKTSDTSFTLTTSKAAGGVGFIFDTPAGYASSDVIVRFAMNGGVMTSIMGNGDITKGKDEKFTISSSLAATGGADTAFELKTAAGLVTADKIVSLTVNGAEKAYVNGDGKGFFVGADAGSAKITNVDTPAAGTDAANKTYVDAAFAYGAKLASVSVNVGAVAVTPLYTVPALKTCNIKGISIRGASGTFDQAIDPIFNVGWDAVASNVVNTATYVTPTAATTSIELTIVAEKTVGAAASVLNFNVTTAATAATTATVDVFGYCY